MSKRNLAAVVSGATLGLLLAVGLASPAGAVTDEQRLSVLSSWTQTGASSYHDWNSARQNQSAWAEYAFDWSTDYCSSSPDNPLGFDFRLSCHRHDFGYRNYKAAGLFSANKPRLDDAFYADLSRKCDTYSSSVRPACDSLAWIYYQAVRAFGSPSVTPEQLSDAAALKQAGEARMAAAATT